MKYKLPVECLCSWEDKSVVVHRRKGGEFLSNASVLMDRIVQEGDYLWLGSLEDLKKKHPNYQNPKNVTDAHPIEKTETIGELKTDDIKKDPDMNKVAHWAYL
jgi:hypothetical protein